MKFNTPVVFIIFNRPDTTAKVFAEIAKAKPSKLYIIADGPRAERPDDIQNCAAARAVVESVDWECEVYKNYSEKNLGCGTRVSSGLDWVFSREEKAIILEDDCFPEPSFFSFCAEMLNIYETREEIMLITGTNLLGTWKRNTQSYHASRYGSVWGWASWRRAWMKYDFRIKQWEKEESRIKLRERLDDEVQFQYWSNAFNAVYQGMIDTWDYQWTLAYLLDGMTLVPSVNLISNLGFGSLATHTTSSDSKLSNARTYPLKFPLKHPSNVFVDQEYDRLWFARLTQLTIEERVYRKVKFVLRRLVQSKSL